MDAERKAASYDVQSMTQSCALSDTDFSGEAYDQIVENRFLNTAVNPLSTFSIDVDTASYSNVRRFLKQGQLPPAGAVRIEEMLNYFPYEYPPPSGDEPFSASIEMAGCPWNPHTPWHALL